MEKFGPVSFRIAFFNLWYFRSSNYHFWQYLKNDIIMGPEPLSLWASSKIFLLEGSVMVDWASKWGFEMLICNILLPGYRVTKCVYIAACLSMPILSSEILNSADFFSRFWTGYLNFIRKSSGSILNLVEKVLIQLILMSTIIMCWIHPPINCGDVGKSRLYK